MKLMNNKTSTHIEIVPVDQNLFGTNSVIVRPPKYLQCFRCTVIFQCARSNKGNGYLSTVSEQNELNTLRFSNLTITSTNTPPSSDTSVIDGIQTFVFDRLGVGYMVENFYISSDADGAYEKFIFIWEGNIQST